jgi:hypothetical protein
MVVGGASLLSRASIGERADVPEKSRLRCSDWCRLRVCRILDCVLRARDNVRGGKLLSPALARFLGVSSLANFCSFCRSSPSPVRLSLPAGIQQRQRRRRSPLVRSRRTLRDLTNARTLSFSNSIDVEGEDDATYHPCPHFGQRFIGRLRNASIAEALADSSPAMPLAASIE